MADTKYTKYALPYIYRFDGCLGPNFKKGRILCEIKLSRLSGTSDIYIIISIKNTLDSNMNIADVGEEYNSGLKV